MQTGSPTTGVGQNGVPGGLFLKNYVLAGNFTKIFFPQATDLYIFG
jgi:hypothetical protein